MQKGQKKIALLRRPYIPATFFTPTPKAFLSNFCPIFIKDISQNFGVGV